MPIFQSQLLDRVRGLPSPFTIVVSVVLLTFLHKLLLLLRRQHDDNMKSPPSPPRLPIIGNLHQLIMGGKLPHRSLHSLSEKYGPLMLLHLGQSPTLVVSSAEIVEEIVKHHDVVFSNRPSTTAVKILFYGGADFGFAPYGEYWRKARKICVTELLSHKRVESFRLAREEEVASLIHKIKSSSSGVVDLSEMVRATNFDIFCRVIMGHKDKSEEEGRDGEFGELAKRYATLLLDTSFGDLFPNCMGIGSLVDHVVTRLVPRLRATFAETDAFLASVIQQEEERQQQRANLEEDIIIDEKNFVQILVHLQKEGLLGFTHENLKAILLDMFLGANDTTPTTIEWAMAELMKNPKVMEKGQEEVRRVVGRKGKVDEHDVNQMAYLKCIVKEALRLHPPTPLMLPRETCARIKIKGYDILPKTTVLFNVWAIQRDPKYWDRPEDFIPERFENNPVDFRGQLDLEFIPFGVGRRGCPRSPFAVAVLQLVLANLLYWFDWKLPGDNTTDHAHTLDMTEAQGVVAYKKFPLQLVPINYVY